MEPDKVLSASSTTFYIEPTIPVEAVLLSIALIMLGSGFRLAGAGLVAWALLWKARFALYRWIGIRFLDANSLIPGDPITEERFNAFQRSYMLLTLGGGIVLVVVAAAFTYRYWLPLRERDDFRSTWMIRFGQVSIVFWVVRYALSAIPFYFTSLR